MTPYPNQKTKSITEELRVDRNQQIPLKDQQQFPTLLECNGNTHCLKTTSTDVMCPSFQVTHDIKQSPKGRSDLLREWLIQGKQNTPLENDIFKALETCLSCKACVTQCPVNINIPTYKSYFLNPYYKTRSRPLKEWIIGYLEHLIPILGITPKLSNQFLQIPVIKWLINTFGITNIPHFITPSISSELKQYPIPTYSNNNAELNTLENPIIIIQDIFTRYFRPSLLIDFCKIAKTIGFDPVLFPLMPTGKGFHIKGFKTKFQATAEKFSQRLNIFNNQNMPIVCLEPSIGLLLREEYTHLINQHTLKIELPQEWLLKNLPKKIKKQEKKDYILLGHCQESTANKELNTKWKKLFKKLQLNLEIAPISCCGMAGVFGHEINTASLSKKIYDQSWLPLLNNKKKNTRFLTTGFSCMHQIQLNSNKSTKHPINIIKDALRASI